ncbi:MAG: aldehyde oxidoreductase [Bacteroidetes bacterium SW_9_63_38]|nr:MAG: aldehyde oxidoreductase [Bacteroidetes bacterium SW_9_63_38]
METLTFDDGDEMPILGLGTWKSDPGDVYNAVKVALEVGYRHIDCAPIYGNEPEVGNALSDTFSAHDIDRGDVWVTSKLWNDCHDPEHVRPALENTLNDLQLDTLDLYLVHWPVAMQHGVDYPEQPDDFVPLGELPLAETWHAMQDLKAEGLVQHIGVSNFSVQKIQSLIDETGTTPEMNQIEMHPYLQQPDMLDFAEEKGVHLTAYSPLGSMDRPEEIKADDEPNLFEDPTIQEIADQHDASAAQVLISWAIHRGTAVIPKSVTPAHIEDNLAAADLSLSNADMDAIADLDRHRRYLDGSIWTFEGSPYSKASLWDE